MSDDREFYSVDNERFDDCLATVLDDAYYNDAEFIYVGKKKDLSYIDFFNPHWVIEEMQEQMHSDFDDFYSGYLDRITGDDIKELSKLINDFITSKVGPVPFHGIKNVKKVPVKDLQEQGDEE